jgi:hypothetical protein
LQFNPDGSISGTPSEVNFTTFTVTVTDSGSLTQSTQLSNQLQSWAPASTQCPGGTFPLFNNWNTGGVTGGGKNPSFGVPPRPNGYTVVFMSDYHLDPTGQTSPAVGLTSAVTTFGPYPVNVVPATPGFANWQTQSIPAGVVLTTTTGPFQVNDNDIATWSNNSGSGFLGFSAVCVTPN